MKKVLFLLIIFSLFHFHSFSQSVGINYSGVGANPNALLDADVTGGVSKGMLIPRMTSALRTAMTFTTSAQGLVVYQTDGLQGFYYNTSATTTPNWVSLLSSSGTIKVQASTPEATGGTITTSGIWTVHTFTTSGTFSVTNGPIYTEYLVVAGGGGGGTVGGGGGGGGVISGATQINTGSYSITVGSGGNGGAAGAGNNGIQGGNSIIAGIETAIGGGYGGGNANMGGNGGSGGGGAAVSLAGGSATLNQGYDGSSAGGAAYYPTGGGGGAGTIGTAGGAVANKGGNGGDGLLSDISGSFISYAAGGGGSVRTGGAGAGSGGASGGGTGGYNAAGGAATSYGSGGGGGGYNGTWFAGGNGKAGIVIIRYITDPATIFGDENGKVSIGTTSPTAYLHLPGGRSDANYAPLKFTSGTNLTTPEAGAMEFNGSDLFFSPSSTRKTIWMSGNAIPTASVTGTILRADGTNWIATTNTYPTTTGVGQILHATGANTISSTSDFVRLATGELILGATSQIASEKLSVQANANSTTSLFVSNTTSGTGAKASVSALQNGAVGITMQVLSGSFTASGINQPNFGVLLMNTSGGGNVGTTTATPLALWTNNTERARFLSTGEFLIGATSLIGTESFKVQKNNNGDAWGVVNNSTDGTASRSFFQVRNGAAGTNLSIYAYSPSYTTSGNQIAASVLMQSNSAAGLTISSYQSAPIRFWVNSVQRSTILADGSFISGTSFAPVLGVANGIYLQSVGTTAAIQAENTSASGSIGGGSMFLTTNDNAAIINGDRLGAIQFCGSRSAGSVVSSSSIQAYAAETWSTSQRGSFITFNTNAKTTNTISEKLRITDVGNVSIGGIVDRASTVGTNAVQIFNGTAPAGTLTNGVSLYSESGILKSLDAAGTGGQVFSGLVGSASLDFASTAAGAVADLTITVTGASLNDPVILGAPHGSITATATFTAWVSAANTVTVRFSPKATEDPASGTFKVSVLKY